MPPKNVSKVSKASSDGWMLPVLVAIVAFCYWVPIEPDSSIIAIFRRASCGYLLFLCIVGICSWEKLWRSMDGDRWYHYFYFMTHWAVLLALVYFFVVSFRIAPSSHSSSLGDHRYLDGAVASTWFAGIVWHVSTTMSGLATLVFWPAIFTLKRYAGRKDGTNMLSMFVCIGQHGISLVLLIVDVLLSAATDLSVAAAYNYPEGLCATIGVGLVYQAWLIGVYYVEGFWVYGFMDPRRPLANLATYATLALCCFAVHIARTALG